MSQPVADDGTAPRSDTPSSPFAAADGVHSPDSLRQKAFVHADGFLAEFLCRVHLLELSAARARELRAIHRSHHPDECTVHLETAYLLLISDGEGV
ncbi:hypothetical protein [Nocardia veterana]|uniref:hypothetical protein n=1 Tax=Nocardia veterana TaxID=132249 RepID=UPI001FDF3035|nr:hypothetical protein [Nocardia veterana]